MNYPASFDQEWKGDRKIVIGVDFGTEYSSVSFAFLETGMRVTTHRVTKWPGMGLEHQSRVPTAVWYDPNMKAVSFGAETLSPETRELAESNHWTLAKSFKLHLFPEDLRSYG
ncbi:hypothetical protein FRC11_000496, partial [Ceratobasidium sp. 423]